MTVATLTTDRPCVACGYNLRGMPADGDCPECGNPIPQSLRLNWMYHAGPAWRKRMVWGSNLAFFGLIGSLLRFEYRSVDMWWNYLGHLAAGAGVMILLAGLWLLMQPAPEHRQAGAWPSARETGRALTVVLLFLLFIPPSPAGSTGPDLADEAGGLFFVVLGGWIAAADTYFARVLDRLGHPKVARRLRQLRWFTWASCALFGLVTLIVPRVLAPTARASSGFVINDETYDLPLWLDIVVVPGALVMVVCLIWQYILAFKTVLRIHDACLGRRRGAYPG